MILLQGFYCGQTFPLYITAKISSPNKQMLEILVLNLFILQSFRVKNADSYDKFGYFCRVSIVDRLFLCMLQVKLAVQTDKCLRFW